MRTTLGAALSEANRRQTVSPKEVPEMSLSQPWHWLRTGSPIVGVVLLLAGCGGDDDPADATPIDPAMIVLRLADLSPGYQVGDDAGCAERLDLEEYDGTLNEVLFEHRSASCYQQLEYFGAARPPDLAPLIESVAVVSDSVAGAKAIMAERATLLWYEGGVSDIEEERTGETIGDETFVVSAGDKLVAGQTGGNASAVVWRSGLVVNFVLVAGLDPSENARLAWEFARRQQQYIDEPVAVTTTDSDDREAPLNRPDLGVTVYWVGREFDPGGGLPTVELRDSHATGTPMGPGSRVDLEYELPGSHGTAFRLMLWAPKEWEAFLGGEIGTAIMPARCVAKEIVDIRGGKLELWRVPTPGTGGDCPAVYEAVFGVVFMEGAVVTINQPIMIDFRPAQGPFGTAEGVEAIARGLVAR